MGPIKIRPDEAAAELKKIGDKLAAATRTLREVDEVEYGCTPKEEVWRDGKVVLYRFKGERKPTAKVPVLIVYALVNTPYMVDLQSDRSIVRNLLAQGEDVYLIDWGYPDPSDKFVSLDDYINGWIRRAVDFIAKQHALDAINLIGICQGGVFSLCFASIYPDKVKNLVTMVTPVDFHTDDNMLAGWTRSVDADLLVDTLGNIPGDLMNYTYLTLKPFRLNFQKYVGLIDLMDDKAEIENFLRMEKWIFDSPDQAGEAFRQFTKDFYQKNGLVKGGVDIGGKHVDLKNVTMPVLNVYAEQDHLVPPSASKPMKNLVGTNDYTELAFKGGHIGIYVSGRSQREVPPAISSWLGKRSG